MNRLAIWFVLMGLSAQAQSVELVVSAAASLMAVLNEAKPLFEATHSGTRLYYNFAASGTLERQIDGGAPVDVFVSASAQPMDQLQAHHRILEDTRVNLASNELVLIVPKQAKVRFMGFEDLPKATRIAIGDPGFVPAGQYAMQIFIHLGLQAQIQPKLVYAQDVRQVLEYVARSEVDAGVVFATDALLMPDKVERVARAPAESHHPVLYPAALIADGKNPELSRAFLDFLTNTQGRTLFEKHGFVVWTLK